MNTLHPDALVIAGMIRVSRLPTGTGKFVALEATRLLTDVTGDDAIQAYGPKPIGCAPVMALNALIGPGRGMQSRCKAMDAVRRAFRADGIARKRPASASSPFDGLIV